MKTLLAVYFIAATVIFFSCEKTSSGSASSVTGQGGSLAKFTIIGNYVYAVSRHYLYTVDISDPAHPANVKQSTLNYDMETIYPYKNMLFIGSVTGIYIYSIDTPSAPRLIGLAKHGRSCDPVVANDSVSYSTLRSGTSCGPATSGLYIYDVKNLDSPALKKLIELNNPIGLGMSDSALYVCCQEGLKTFSIKSAYDPIEISTISGSGFTDVIPYYDVLICWVSDGICLYDISDRLKPVFIKKIPNS